MTSGSPAPEPQQEEEAVPETDPDPAPADTPPERERDHPIFRDILISLLSVALVAGAIVVVQLVRNRGGAGSAVAAGLPSGDYTAVRLGVVGNGSTKIGSEAPAFQLTVPSGELIRLSDLRGKVVLLNFWATWCSPCRREIPDLVRLQNQWGGSVQIVGIDLQETPSEVSAFAGQMQMNYPVPLDSDGQVASYYRIRGLPTTYFLDPQGVIRDIRIGLLRPEIATCIVDGIERGQHNPSDCR